MTTGKRIRELRKQNNKTLGEFAIEIGVTASAVSQIENERQEPSFKVISAICEKFNVSSDWLLFGKNSEEFDNFNKQEKVRFNIKNKNYHYGFINYEFDKMNGGDAIKKGLSELDKIAKDTPDDEYIIIHPKIKEYIELQTMILSLLLMGNFLKKGE